MGAMGYTVAQALRACRVEVNESDIMGWINGHLPPPEDIKRAVEICETLEIPEGVDALARSGVKIDLATRLKSHSLKGEELVRAWALGYRLEFDGNIDFDCDPNILLKAIIVGMPVRNREKDAYQTAIKATPEIFADFVVQTVDAGEALDRSSGELLQNLWYFRSKENKTTDKMSLVALRLIQNLCDADLPAHALALALKYRAVAPEGDLSTARASFALSLALHENARDQDASEELDAAAIPLYTRHLGRSHDETLEARFMRLLYTKDPIRKIEYAEVFAADLRVLFPTGDLRVCRVEGTLGSCYGENGNHAKQITILLRVIEEKKRLLGPRSIELACTYYNLGRAFIAVGDLYRAKFSVELALDIRRAVLGPTSPEVTRTQVLFLEIARMHEFVNNQETAVYHNGVEIAARSESRIVHRMW